MGKTLDILLNILFFTVVAIIAFSVATIALTKKVNDYRRDYNRGIIGTVIKQEVPVLSYTKAIVKKVHVATGDEVKKNQIILEFDNQGLRRKIQALEDYPENISAQTEAQVAREELKNFTIYAPGDSVVGDVKVTAGLPVETFSHVITLYSNDNIRVLAELTVDQYQEIKKQLELKAYSPRLNQNFVIKPLILKPDTTKPLNFEEKKVGLYFTFKDKAYAKDLLHNEDLELRIGGQQENIDRPIDFIVTFWNNLLFNNK